MIENFTRELNGSALAYVGDAALELLVRRYLISLGITGSGKLNSLALRFVRATAQSAAVDLLLPHLTEEEEYIFKRGRNAHGISIPKSASALEYRRATGMEALFGYLCLAGKDKRADELFKIAYAGVISELSSKSDLTV
jgi:ribonuclease-3 family protein